MQLRKRIGWQIFYGSVIFNLLALCLTVHGVQTGSFIESNPIMAWALKKGILTVLAIASIGYILIALLYHKKHMIATPIMALLVWGGDLAWDITLIGVIGI